MRGSPTAKGAAGTLVKEGLRLTIGLRAQPQQQAPASGKPQILSHRLGVVGATGSASALGLQKGVTDAQTGWQDPALLQSQWRAGVPWASLTGGDLFEGLVSWRIHVFTPRSPASVLSP